MPIREVHLMTSSMQVVALAGGVGGARLADGLAQVLPPEHLTVIVNVGDDFEHLGLRICPDLDTVCYTLAGIANPETGWGRADESWQVLDTLAELGWSDLVPPGRSRPGAAPGANRTAAHGLAAEPGDL